MCEIAYDSLNIDYIYPKFDTGIAFRPPIQYVFQISARLKHVYASYSNFAKEGKTKKFL